MQEDPTSAEQLIDKAEAYGKTTLELIRLKSIDKTADVLSYLAGYFILFIFMAVFAMLIACSASRALSHDPGYRACPLPVPVRRRLRKASARGSSAGSLRIFG